jgi:hypothetical protein
MDADMTAPTAVAAIATVMVEPEKRSSMIISFRHELRHELHHASPRT